MAKEEKSKKRKTGAITQEEVSTLLLRYPVKTVLTLLHEVAKVAQEKIDWNEIVKNTATGISSARECQMLWRHLAYGESLTDQFDYAANPMDDDSDLENEMQAFPAVNREASVEASAYVKVLNASNYPIDSHVPNNWTIEAPLTINIPKFKVPADSSLPANAMQGTNVSIHVSVEREKLLSRLCGEKRPNDGKPGDGFASQRKRKVWSTEDDVKLTAARQKHGEQNWAINASEEFNNDRKASRLSQRWPNIRKKMGNLIAGTSSGLSEAQKAASRAILIALEPEHLKAVPQMSNVGTKPQYESITQLAIVGPPSEVPTRKPSANCIMGSNPTVEAAAGSGIAASTDACSVIRAAACSENVVYMRTGVGSSTSMPSQLSSNTHISCNGPTKRAISNFFTTLPGPRHGEAQIAQGNSINPAESSVRLTPPMGSSPVVGVSDNGVANPVKLDEVSAKASEMRTLAEREMELISECHTTLTGNQSKQKVDEHQNSASCNKLGGNTQGDRASISHSDPTNQTQGQGVQRCWEVEDNGKRHADGVTIGEVIHEETTD